MTKDVISSGSSTTVASYAYTLGPAGNRIAVAELGGRQVRYTYDQLYRLTGESIAGGSVNGSIGYTYDPVGNRLSRTSTVAPVSAATYAYDANDLLTTDSYDANGSTVGSGGNSYTYDFENHLLTQSGSTPVSIVYDGNGNRVAETANGITTKYLVDDRNPTGYAQVVEEISGGSVQRAYTYGLSRISENQASGTSFYGYDGHGNVRLLLDATGAVTDRYDYEAFGLLITSLGSTSNSYLYANELLDPSLNLYYMRARYLAASTGRFVNPGLVRPAPEIPISIDRYIYAFDRPTDFGDPTRRGPCRCAHLAVVLCICNLTESQILADLSLRRRWSGYPSTDRRRERTFAGVAPDNAQASEAVAVASASPRDLLLQKTFRLAVFSTVELQHHGS